MRSSRKEDAEKSKKVRISMDGHSLDRQGIEKVFQTREKWLKKKQNKTQKKQKLDFMVRCLKSPSGKGNCEGGRAQNHTATHPSHVLTFTVNRPAYSQSLGSASFMVSQSCCGLGRGRGSKNL